jgi:hypothetical protein
MKTIVATLFGLLLGVPAQAALFPTPVASTIVVQGYQVAGSGGSGSTVMTYTPSTDQILCTSIALNVTTSDTVTVNVVYTRATDGLVMTVPIINSASEATNTDDSASHCFNAKAGTSVMVKLVSATTTKASGSIRRDK